MNFELNNDAVFRVLYLGLRLCLQSKHCSIIATTATPSPAQHCISVMYCALATLKTTTLQLLRYTHKRSNISPMHTFYMQRRVSNV